MQFVDVRTMLRLPLADIAGGCALISRILKIVRRIRQLPALGLAGGCNFAAASFLFNIIAGSSVCFYNTSEGAFTTRSDRKDRFKKLLADFYPWQGEPVSQAQAIDVLYEAARNPLTHTLGLDAPPAPGRAPREIVLAKSPLTVIQIAELEDRAAKPPWLPATIARAAAASGSDRFVISVPALYWGVHRMLHALFADAKQAGDADAVAKKFGPLWDKYMTAGDVASVNLIDAGRCM